MKRIFFLSQVLTFSLLFLATTRVLGQNYEEVSYDDLVNRLNKKKNQVIRSTSSPLDDIMIHAGFGLVTSITTVKVNSQESTRQQNGFQLSFGIDLFSPQWIAEGAIRNFGNSSSGYETRSLRETDMKVLYRGRFSEQSAFRLGGGIGNRYFSLSDSMKGLSIEDTTPSWILFSGLDAVMSKNFSLGIEAGFRSAMVNRTIDKNALDFSLKMDTSF